ncbi:uncharacterized protein LOC123867034 isoform X1 [Maniola jurtina]|uniref:uncharacterized protein LOC123867034 isoform X1 n=1 Tax=Maniola jurtina TaxID=191418 RepID=UPI001E686067|nr:uncharacterized protein LOC123867034 isoform X1 [Maniola jurtina]
MTVITKPSGILTKQVIINPPQLEFEPNGKQACDEEKIEIQPEWPKRSTGSGMCCILLGAMMLMFLGFVVGLMLYQQFMRPATVRRYQGFCSIPIPNDIRENSMETNYRVLPLRWSTDADVQIVSTVDEEAGEDFVNALREELDLGDSVEKISVLNNGHRVNFIHDFNDNTTGIVDDERCFIMDLEPELVLSPELFITGLEQGGQFDVSRVRSNVKAALPALQELSRAATELAAKCFSRPIYRLYRDEGVVIRKRSADDPKHDYIQFSGKHVLELKIDNLPEILAYEKKIKGN